MRFCDEWEHGFGWIHPRPAWMERASHALETGGRVWVVDPVDGEGIEERIRALGEPAAVIQLLDRHGRDCAELALRLGVPHFHVPVAGVPDSPFDSVQILDRRRWREIGLWWAEERTLVLADALGTAPHYLARGERLAVNPLLRLAPPRVLRRFAPRRLLFGHGEGIQGDEVALLLKEALATSRRRALRWFRSYVGMVIAR